MDKSDPIKIRSELFYNAVNEINQAELVNRKSNRVSPVPFKWVSD